MKSSYQHQQQPVPGDFIPEKISIKTRQGRRRGDAANASTKLGSGGGKEQQQHHESGISSSVVFHEDCEIFDEIDALYPHDHEGGKLVSDPNNKQSTSTDTSSNTDSFNTGMSLSRSGGRPRSDSNLSASNSRSITSSVLQSLRDSDYETLVSSANSGTLANMIAGIEDRYRGSTTLSAASMQQHNQNGGNKITGYSRNSSNESYNMNGSSNKRESIVGGKQMCDMSFDEQRELLAPERSDRSLVVDVEEEGDNMNEFEVQQQVGGAPLDISKRSGMDGSNRSGRSGLDSSNRSGKSHHTICSYSPTITSEENSNQNVIVSSVDWSSLSKSCKRAKNAFRDADSGQMVVKNMFITHLNALTTVLTLYAKRYCGKNKKKDDGVECSLQEIKTRITETKRALRFAMACLAPPRVEGEANEGESPKSGTSAENEDGVEKYRIARRYRQELQDVAVKGMSGSSLNEAREMTNQTSHHYGIHIPLVEIILTDKPWSLLNDEDDDSVANQYAAGDYDEDERAKIMSSIEGEKRTVRVLAARLLCNLVTDNPHAAEMVLADVPFSPCLDQVESRMAGSMLGSPREGRDGKDDLIFWTDLITATAKEGTSAASGNVKGKHGADTSHDREALAAVAASLHNLLTSLEARESLMEYDDEMKRREDAKNRRKASRQDSWKMMTVEEIEVEEPMEPIDVGFEIASNGPLMNALLRNILPAKAVIMQSQLEKERMEPSRPKFKPPVSEAENLADSATEWISLVLERLASRGLLGHMLRSAGGAKIGYVTPEQVVLISCVRQAVDDYHSTLTPTGETGGFGRRRLSIAAKSAGMAVTTRPHPLWGRADLGAGGKAVKGRDSRTAVPVLLSLANEVEEFRLRANELREGKSCEIYDGEQNCTIRMIDDLCDILAQSLGRHASSPGSGSPTNSHSIISDARSVLGRETSLISSCCQDLARILDAALAANSGRKARELTLSAQDQQSAIILVRLIGNIIYQCRYNQDLLRITKCPTLDAGLGTSTNTGAPMERAGLHVILSSTSLAPACFTLREWCIVAIRNAVEGNAANAETVRRLEANQVVDDTPELRRMGVKIDLDAKGKVHVKRRD